MPRPTRIISDTVITSSVTGAANAAQNMNANSECVYETPATWMGGIAELDKNSQETVVIGTIDLTAEELADQLIVCWDLFGFMDNLTDDTSLSNIRFNTLATPLDQDPESSTSLGGSSNYSPRTGLSYTPNRAFLQTHTFAFTPVALATGTQFGVWHWEYKMAINLAKVTDFATSAAQWRQIHSSSIRYNPVCGFTSTSSTMQTGTHAAISDYDFSNGIRISACMRKPANYISRVVCSGGVMRTIPETSRPGLILGSPR